MKKISLRKEDIHYGDLILINRDNPIRIKESEIVSDLTGLCGTIHLLRKGPAEIIHKILGEIDTSNEIVAVSSFRSKREQEEIYNSCLREYGIDFTKKYVARPDESEHQSGLAIDLGENKEDIDFICPEFPYYGVFNDFRKKTVENGFIERYKEDKESITGISKEPWHFRYIGYPHSFIMEEKDLCLEEYHIFIKNFKSEENSYIYEDDKHIWRIFYLELKDEEVSIEISNDYDFTISGNNRDGFIVTQYKAL